MKNTSSKRITKSHIICHLIATFGPLTRKQVLKLTAEKEGKPYRPNSNNSYFVPHLNNSNFGYGSAFPKLLKQWRNASLVGNGSLKVVGKCGNALVYGLDTRGARLAKEFLEMTGV